MRTILFPQHHACRYTSSPVVGWLDDFAAWLIASGYNRTTLRNHMSIVRAVLERRAPLPRDTRFSSEDLKQMFVSAQRPKSFHAARKAFERFLRTRGQWVEMPRTSPHAALLGGYHTHLIEIRGLTVTTAERHIAIAEAFLHQCSSAHRRLRDLTSREVERFIAVRARCLGRAALQNSVGCLRAFLRYCYDRQALRVRLDQIDTPRKFRDERPPRAIPWNLAQRLLRSIDRTTRLGSRDHAILFLMTHYGLRTGEITLLTVESINRQAGTLRVAQSKTRSMLTLPLTESTTRIIDHYLRHGRPRTDRGELFLSALAPVRPMTRGAIAEMYARRVRASGLPLQSSSPYGLRHGFAMRLLERDVGLKAIGDILGHRTLESTGVYLRLHTDALRDVALALPRRSRRVP